MAADPVGLIGAGNVHFPRPAAPKPAQLQDGKGFKDLLMENLGEVNKLQQDATRAVEDFQAGKRDDVEQVMLATQQADTAFRMLLQVRNKVVEAYDEMKQIRV